MSRDFSNAQIVNNISDEYEIIRKTICDCDGNYTVKMQSLVENKTIFYNILICICQICNKEKEFILDINSFFRNWS
ncbi:MAG: hypothetical protein ACFFD2_05520 [Promethearchaeota archaeon]